MALSRAGTWLGFRASGSGPDGTALLYSKTAVALAVSLDAGVAELADAPDSKSGSPQGECGFDPLLRHHSLRYARLGAEGGAQALGRRRSRAVASAARPPRRTPRRRVARRAGRRRGSTHWAGGALAPWPLRLDPSSNTTPARRSAGGPQAGANALGRRRSRAVAFAARPPRLTPRRRVARRRAAGGGRRTGPAALSRRGLRGSTPSPNPTPVRRGGRAEGGGSGTGSAALTKSPRVRSLDPVLRTDNRSTIAIRALRD